MLIQNRSVRRCLLLIAALLTVAGCAQHAQIPQPHPKEVRAKIVRLMPAEIPDRNGWATDIQSAFSTLDIPPTDENLCAVLAVTVQESTFQAAPPVPGLAKIAREEIYRRAARLHVPRFVVDTALRLESPDGQSYDKRLSKVRTEKELSAIFDDFLNVVPLGSQLFGKFNPVRTGGPMQVSIAFAEARARDYPYAREGTIRDEVFSRRGGMYFGIAHLLDYPANYSRPLYRFADFNAGWYASRNAAFQQALSLASGIELALDGDLIIHGSRKAGSTELAARSLGKRLRMSNSAIRRALEKGDSLEFEETRLYERVFDLAEQIEGKPMPREVLPGIKLKSPKITRNLTTAWFAQRVDERHRRCMARAAQL
ncbi:DUF1615 domain-containing protein [Stutzerimonas stutzeri]|uniref:DUF1615 domain-containing protein n=1 Tax=Stutzerimonas stutzeri TaxID=316 RepID=UPI0026593EEE|nr:DUF1615 domain-containing protein [Stutzerimonas stutzeri]MCF6781234.1 DUF1615 domain-containing protein [Stutzerimonas stutzeri]MCF6805130.1 DUF1615 domain-containing protein [Stutzerimonas stutzeri]